MAESERERSFLDHGRAAAILPPLAVLALSLPPEARGREKRAIGLFGAEDPGITLPAWRIPITRPSDS